MTPSPLQDVTAAAASARSMGVGWGARGGAADDAESTPSQSAGETTDTGEGVKKKKKTDRTSRQTQAGIGHNVEEFTRTHSTSSQAGHPDCWRRPDHDCASYMYTESTPPSRSGGDSSNLSPPAPPSPLPCVRPQYRLLPLRFASSSLPYMLDVVAFPQQEPL